MNKKKLLIGLVLSIFVIPLLASLSANLLSFAAPGLVGGLFLILGVVWFIYWVRTDNHKEQPTDNSP